MEGVRDQDGRILDVGSGDADSHRIDHNLAFLHTGRLDIGEFDAAGYFFTHRIVSRIGYRTRLSAFIQLQ
jgi:hypothetical protein